MNAVGIIPARWASTRFPGKPLIDLGGVPLVVHVARRAHRAAELDRVIVATDDARIQAAVAAAGFRSIRTSAGCRTGTDRVAEVARALGDAQLVVNCQGDEPFVDPRELDRLVRAMRARVAPMGTLAAPLSGDDASRARVWVEIRPDGRARRFGRGFPPRGSVGVEVAHHVGVYAYRPEVLQSLARRPESPRERAEALEQWRALENEVPIHVTMCQSEHPGLGVDTWADAERARAWLASHPD